MESVRILMAELVDYAGLFPPANLDMATTVANYARYACSDSASMLGRLIVPVARLDEFESAAKTLLPTGEDDMPWMISALLPAVGTCDLHEAVDAILRFNSTHSAPGRGLALIDTVEMRAASARQIDDALDDLPDDLAPFFEVAPSPDPRGLIASLAGTPGRAKIRTGGVTPDAIPPMRDVLGFLLACAAAGVPFKATAGLHHPVRAEHALTYSSNAPRARMHGFLNVFVAACAIRSNLVDEPAAADILEESDTGAFLFDDEGLSWRELRITNDRLARARQEFCLSFGACSFEEPANDLAQLKLL